MDESEEGKEKPILPAQQAQQPQPLQSAEDEGWPARRPAPAGEINNVWAMTLPESDDSADPGMDQARFTAGVVRWYEAVLKEPVPEKMVRLVQEIAKRERKS